MWRETRIGVELAGLMRSGVWRGEGVTPGQDQPVMLISGLFAGDQSMNLMAGWLKRTGHRPCRAGIAVNVDCSQRAAEKLERRLECLAEDSGQKVAVVGQSRGGSFARVLAVRRPDLVSGVVALGSPLKHQLAIHPLVHASVLGMGVLGTVGVDGFMSRSCLWGDCCDSFWGDFASDFPAGVGYVSLYSRTDGIVKWKACLDPAAEPVEVRASHIGMAVNAEVYRAVAASLEGLRAAEAVKKPRRASQPKRHLRLAA
jgi:pimeloyl-ACP methyl ester carboxylesterase